MRSAFLTIFLAGLLSPVSAGSNIAPGVSSVEVPKAVHLKTAKDSPDAPLPQAEWTVMAFINGKSNLALGAQNFFNYMEIVGSSDKVYLVAELGLSAGYTMSDGSKWTSGSKRYFVKGDYTVGDSTQAVASEMAKINSPALMETPDADMGDYRRAIDFVKWAKAKFPAKHYMLFIWNHGSGWQDLPTRSGSRGISYDYETQNLIKTREISAILAAAGPIDVLYMSACLMQTAEVDYEIRNLTKVIIASEEISCYSEVEMRPFWSLKRNPLMSPEEIGAMAVKTYINYFEEFGTERPVTLSAIRAGEFSRFGQKLDDWAACALRANETEVMNNASVTVLRFGKGLWDSADLGDFLSIVSSTTASSELKQKSDELLSFISENLIVANGAVNSPYHTSQDYNKARGISISLPKPGLAPASSTTPYADLTLSKYPNWSRFHDWLLSIPAAAK